MVVQIPVVYGDWIMKDGTWHFELDTRKGGRMFILGDGFTHRELVEMARDDYKLQKMEVVELTYSLPSSMVEQMPHDTPPMHVTNDRQVHSLMELRRTCMIRLCVSSRFETETDINGDANSDEDENNDEDENPQNDEDEDEDECNDGEVKEEEVKEDEVKEEAVKEEYGENIDDDYSEYGKVKDEDGEDISFDVEACRSSMFTWSDNIFVSQSFGSKAELVRELQLTCVMLRFAYKVLKSEPKLFVAICCVEGCQWRLRAAVKNEANRFWVTKYINVHTCSRDDRVKHRKRATAKYIGRLFYERVGIINGITPQHIKDAMKQMYGMILDYTTSYRALCYAREMVRGTWENGYESLPSYLHQIKEANPGTITALEVDEENRFKYLFLSFGASIEGFKYLRRVIVVDGTHLTGKYEGVLLVACAQDANFQIFPLAFGIVDSETNASWEWFFTKLSDCVSEQGNLVIVSDREIAIKNAIEKVFPKATRGICYYHLQCNIVKKFRGKELMYLVKGAAYAYTEEDYDRYMEAIRSAKPDLATYLEEADPKLWSRVHFPGMRYNIKTSNMAESINAALKVARGFPIAFLLDFIRSKLGRWFYKRREDALSVPTRYSRGVDYLLNIREYYTASMTTERINDVQFYVRGGNRNFLVDMGQGACTCGVFQIERIPCSHVYAVLIECRQDVSTVICPSYERHYLYASYGGSIFRAKDADKCPKEEVLCLPPEVGRKKGRKKKSRWQTWLEIAKRKGTKPRKMNPTYNCTNCGQPGHTKLRCQK